MNEDVILITMTPSAFVIKILFCRTTKRENPAFRTGFSIIF